MPAIKNEVVKIENYIQGCRLRVEQKAHIFFNIDRFLTLSLKQVAVDFFVRAFNVFYSPFFMFVHDVKFWLDEVGIKGPQFVLDLIPPSKLTQFQKDYRNFLSVDIFESKKYLDFACDQKLQNIFIRTSTRRAEKDDLNVSAISIIWGFFFFKGHDFSFFQLSQNWAKEFANRQASSEFILGQNVGRSFYSFFPQEPSFYQLFIAGVLVFLLFGIVVQILTISLFLFQVLTGLYKIKMQRAVEQMRLSLVLESCENKLSGHKKTGQL